MSMLRSLYDFACGVVCYLIISFGMLVFAHSVADDVIHISLYGGYLIVLYNFTRDNRCEKFYKHFVSLGHCS